MSESPNGMIAVFKPKDWTSFDVVAKLRGILHTRKIGHGGTLDPMAEGVLPVFVGKAAKACDIIPDRKKCYRAGFRFGITTETEDITGTVLTSSEKEVGLSRIEEVKAKFIGDIMQIPPMYSAVKVNGRKLYELARQGIVAEREARAIHIDSIIIDEYDESTREGVMTIDCEKGTYVRTVISDMGNALGVGGVMTSLVRTYSGGCSLEDCLTLEEIADKVSQGGAESVLMPVDKAFAVYEEIRLNERLTALYKNGVKLRAEQTDKAPDERTYRVYGADGGFLGLGYFDNDEFRSRKNFFV